MSLILSLVFSFLMPVADSQETEDTKAIIDQAREGWREYKESVRNLQCKVENKLTIDGKLKFHCDSVYKQNRTCRLCIRNYKQGGPRKPTDKAEGFNDKYAFSITKPETSQAWRIDEISLDWKEVARDTNDPHGIMQETEVMVRVNSIELEKLVSREDFKVKRISKSQADGYETVEIEFTTIHDKKQEPFFPIQSGKIVLLPKHKWCVKQAHLDCKFLGSDTDIDCVSEYRVSKGGQYLVPTKHTISQTNKELDGKTTKVIRTLAFMHMEDGFSRDEEFRLSAFGLPEPENIRFDSQYPWYYWGIASAVILLLLGLVLRKIATRAS